MGRDNEIRALRHDGWTLADIAKKFSVSRQRIHQITHDIKVKAETRRERMAKRGFASMNKEKQREIASKGGFAAHKKGTAHEWTSEEARKAGRKGGLKTQLLNRQNKENANAQNESR